MVDFDCKLFYYQPMIFKKDKPESREFEKVDAIISCELKIHMVNNQSSLILGRCEIISRNFDLRAEVSDRKCYHGQWLNITPLRMHRFITKFLLSERSWFSQFFSALDRGDNTYAFNRDEFMYSYWQGIDYFDKHYSNNDSYSTTLNLRHVLYTKASFSIGFESDELDSFGHSSVYNIPNEFITANKNQDESLKTNLEPFYFAPIYN